MICRKKKTGHFNWKFFHFQFTYIYKVSDQSLGYEIYHRGNCDLKSPFMWYTPPPYSIRSPNMSCVICPTRILYLSYPPHCLLLPSISCAPHVANSLHRTHFSTSHTPASLSPHPPDDSSFRASPAPHCPPNLTHRHGASLTIGYGLGKGRGWQRFGVGRELWSPWAGTKCELAAPRAPENGRFWAFTVFHVHCNSYLHFSLSSVHTTFRFSLFSNTPHPQPCFFCCSYLS